MPIRFQSLDTKDSKPIGKGNSLPSNPAAPSLLTLPAEIRNAVYDTLFHVPGGVKVMPSIFCATRDMFEDNSFGKDIAEGFSILFICWQIYHEAATTLFGSNTWIVSRNHWGLGEGSFNGIIWQAAGAGRMLSDFGTRASMVKKIVIDLDRTCSPQCSTHDTLGQPEHDWTDVECAIEMSRLLREISRHPDLDVDFVHPKDKAHYDFHPGSDPSQ